MKLSSVAIFGAAHAYSLDNSTGLKSMGGECSYSDVCTVGGIDGICVSKNSGCCTGSLSSGYCPGSSDIQCCTGALCTTPQVVINAVIPIQH